MSTVRHTVLFSALFDFWTRGPKIRVPVVWLRGASNAMREPQDACTRSGRGAGPGAQVRGSAFPDVRGKGARVSAHSRAPPRAPLPRPLSPEGPQPYSPRSSQRPCRGRPSRLRAMARLRAGSPASTEPAAAPGAGAGAEGSGGARLALPTATPRWGGGGGQVAGTQRGGTCRPDARDKATPRRAARTARSELGVAGTLPGGRALGLRVVGGRGSLRRDRRPGCFQNVCLKASV